MDHNNFNTSTSKRVKTRWKRSAAVNAAVNSFNKELLANHIRTCVARDIREGKDETIDELVATLQKLMK